MFYEELHTLIKKLDITWMKVMLLGKWTEDFVTLWAGIYHCLIITWLNSCLKATELFVGELAWTAYNQLAGYFDVQGEYIKFWYKSIVAASGN